MTALTGSRLKRITADAMLLGAAMMISYLEAVLPLSLAVPLTGVKLGLANIAVMVTFFGCGAADAAAVSAARVLLCGILFGSPVSMAFAAGGALASYLALLAYKYLLHRVLSYIGASLLCAALHVTGQLAAAAIVLSGTAVFAYAPVMLTASVFTGALNGVICTAVIRALNTKAAHNA